MRRGVMRKSRHRHPTRCTCHRIFFRGWDCGRIPSIRIWPLQPLRIKPRAQGPATLSYEFHAMDYLQYAYLESGREKDAWHVIEEIDSVPGASAERKTDERTDFTGRYYFELHQWSEAAKLEVPEPGSREAKASAYRTRAIGAARSGDAAEARKNLEKLNEPVAGRRVLG